jgi:hypothetical protein
MGEGLTLAVERLLSEDGGQSREQEGLSHGDDVGSY